LILAALLLASVAGPPEPAGAWLSEEDGVFRLQLAHQEPGGFDSGVLRIDTRRRRVLWQGTDGEPMCPERIEEPFEDVRSVRAGRDAGFGLELRDGRRFTFLPLPHAAWFAAHAQASSPSLPRAGLPHDVAADIRRAVDAVEEALGRQRAPGAVLRETLHGAPVDVSLAELLQTPTPYEGRGVRVRGRLTAGDPQAGAHQLTEDGVTLTVSAAPEITTVVASRVASWNDQEVEVTGLFRRDPIAGGAPFSIVFWDFAAPDRDAARDRDAQTTTLAALAAGQQTAGRVRVVGRFRGRNLFGDLPQAGEFKGDWVIKDGPDAAWVAGKRPRGDGFVLDVDNVEDTRNWVQVVGRAESRNGLVRLRAESVALVAPPAGGAHVRPGRRINVRRAIAPVVVFALPVEGDALSPDGRLVVQFNKYMDEDTFRGHVRLRYADGGGELPGVKLTYDDWRRALIIEPRDRLQAGRSLECMFLPGIVDADGVPLSPRAGHAAVAGAIEVLRFDVGL
jgi:hypothetical protein